MPKILCWLQDIDRSGVLPISSCKFQHGNESMTGLITSNIANSFPYNNGLAIIELTYDADGNIQVLNLSPLADVLSFNSYTLAMHCSSEKQKSLLMRFVILLTNIHEPDLIPFVKFWSAEADIFRLFLSSPASLNHHHSYQGGLLEHSIEVAEIAFTTAKNLLHSNKECQIALIAGLFHDIGKVYPQLQTRTVRYIPTAHEALSFSLLSSCLNLLAKSDWLSFQALSSTLAPYSRHRSNQHPIENIVRNADRCSAQSSMTRNAFFNKPAHHHYSNTATGTIRRVL